MTAAFDMDGIPPEKALAALDAILESPLFEASDRNKRFLRFVVTEALDGRADHIKAYTIATVVFGRDASFDPQTDPIIRIKASRLRRALEHYYLTAGRDAAVRIDIPKGSYVPTVTRAAGDEAAADHATPEQQRDPPPDPVAASASPHAAIAVARAASSARPWVLASVGAIAGALVAGLLGYFAGAAPEVQASASSAQPRGSAILVMPFEDDGSLAAYAAVARGFSRELAVGLTRYRDLAVYADQLSTRPGQGLIGGADQPRLKIDYLVSGAVSITEDRVRGSVALVDAENGRHLWADRFDAALSPANIFEIREQIANRLTQTLAETYGVIFTEKSKALASKPPRLLSSYECVVRFYAYQRALDASQYDDAKACLERTVAAEPGYGMAFSSLAMIYVDAHRFAFARGKAGSNPLSRARELAQRAIDLDPDEAYGYKAMHNVSWLMNDVPGSLAMGARAVKIAPHDTEALGDLGTRRFYSGDWEAGLALIRETFERNPAAPDAYRIPLVLDAYFHGRYVEAFDEARRIKLPDFIYTHVLVAISAAAAGRDQESAAAIRRILAIEPAFAEKAVRDLRRRNQHPRIIRAIAEGLTQAGLPIQGLSQLSNAEGD